MRVDVYFCLFVRLTHFIANRPDEKQQQTHPVIPSFMFSSWKEWEAKFGYLYFFVLCFFFSPAFSPFCYSVWTTTVLTEKKKELEPK